VIVEAEPHVRLAVFFTQGVSLTTWDDVGSFDREVALYRRLQARGVAVSFVTYGNRDHRDYAHRIPGITILNNRWQLPPAVYARLISLLHRRTLRQCDIVKTNQIPGGEAALRTARWFGKPLIARCGYMWSFNVAKEKGEQAAREARGVEETLFSAASRIVVTTAAMAADVKRRVEGAGERLHIVPNYVDVESFRPDAGTLPQFDLAYVGRLAQEKNISSLLEAARAVGASLQLVGDGPLRQNLIDKPGDVNWQICWRRRVRNSDLPPVFRAAKVFVLPSSYEGHPKALIEAMACGLPVIGGDSPGIRELIRHGENGCLCGTDAASIRQAIRTLLGDEALRRRLGQAARAFAVEHFSLDRVVDLELEVLRQATEGRGA
jgi:glycosyltransferase involved in cell wall biosynthesis